MPLSQRFRTPYREKSHLQFAPGKKARNDVNDAMHIGGAGDMLDLIRSQKSSQSQERSQKGVKVILTRSSKCKLKVAHDMFSERAEPKELEQTPLQPSGYLGDAPSIRREIQSSEIYDFPESPSQDRRKMKREINRRLAERQVLRTIKKMAEELTTLRLRQQQLRQMYAELLF